MSDKKTFGMEIEIYVPRQWALAHIKGIDWYVQEAILYKACYMGHKDNDPGQTLRDLRSCWYCGVGGVQGQKKPEMSMGEWAVKQDGSLAFDADGLFIGVEFISPILEGMDGLLKVKELIDDLRAAGAHISKSCGLHVHVGVLPYTQSMDLNKIWGFLIDLVGTMHRLDAVLLTTTSTSRWDNSSCKVLDDDDDGDWTPARHVGKTLRLLKEGEEHRQFTLNVEPILKALESRFKVDEYLCPTVEFRYAAATLDVHLVWAHIANCMSLCQKAARGREKAPTMFTKSIRATTRKVLWWMDWKKNLDLGQLPIRKMRAAALDMVSTWS
jgi:hypothetical protein